MKNVKNKILSATLALILAATTLTPVTAKAEGSCPNEMTVYLSSTKGKGYTSIYVDDLRENETVEKVKSNKKDTVKPSSLDIFAYKGSCSTQFLDRPDLNREKPIGRKYAYIGCKLLKAGTATVSFNVYDPYVVENPSTKKKVLIKVLAYENPAKTVEIAGIKDGKSTNLAGKTKKQNTANLTLKKKKTDAAVYVKANADKKWKIISASVYNSTTGNTFSRSNLDKGLSSVKFSNIGTINANANARVEVSYRNTKTGGTLDTYYYINDSYSY